MTRGFFGETGFTILQHLKVDPKPSYNPGNRSKTELRAGRPSSAKRESTCLGQVKQTQGSFSKWGPTAHQGTLSVHGIPRRDCFEQLAHDLWTSLLQETGGHPDHDANADKQNLETHTSLRKPSGSPVWFRHFAELAAAPKQGSPIATYGISAMAAKDAARLSLGRFSRRPLLGSAHLTSFPSFSPRTPRKASPAISYPDYDALQCLAVLH